MAYHKLDSMYKLLNGGLNVHTFIVAKNKAEIIDAVHKFENVCTIRTDSEYSMYKLPFYVINGQTDELDDIGNEIESKGLIAIVANGLKYDKSMVYNIVYSIRENGDFWCEYSKEKCTLREMYKFPMTCYIGNINDSIRDWVTIRQTNNCIDKRLIREFLINMWNKGIFDKYVEATTYTELVGMTHENVVFWQITDKSDLENLMFRRTE